MSLFAQRHSPPGLPAGTPIRPDEESPRPMRISVMDYSDGEVHEWDGVTTEDCKAFLDTPTITWIHVRGSFEPEILHALGNTFSLHPLALEDVITSGHRPKAEIYDDQLFIVLSLPGWRYGDLVVDQVSIFFAENIVISFYEGAEEDPFQPVRKRLRQHNGFLHNREADYLFYDLVDVVIDAGFPLLEELGDRIETLENELLENPGREALSRLHTLKRDLLVLRRMIWPHREVVNFLMRDGFPLIQADTKPYLRDCYDHIVHIIELMEAYRDMCASMLDVYLSSASQRLNENMRLLTVISTVFMPLAFITGVYGMNFDRSAGPWNMPELGWRYGYPMVWGIILLVVGGMLLFFWRKKWL